MCVRVNPNIVSADNIPPKSLDRRDVLRLQADAPVKNTGKAGRTNEERGIAMWYSGDIIPDL
jgi:hypothetical protein